MHYPLLWKFRLLRAIRARGVAENRRLLDAWGRAEGGSARNNPLNTTEPWPRSWVYNSAGVRNYLLGSDGIAATARTLTNGRYAGVINDLRKGDLNALDIVARNESQIRTWGTNPDTIRGVLRT